MTNSALNAVVLVCSLKASPARSSSELLGGQLLEAMVPHGVTGTSIRVVDHDVKPGVETDMGDGDGWPTIRAAIMAADILVIATPTWMGQHSSVCMRVLERLDAELAQTDDSGRPQIYPRVAAVAVVGNEDGAHHVSADVFQALDDVGFSLPAQAVTYWNGPAMHKTDYQDLDGTPEETATATRLVASNTAHLARVLRDHPYPAAQ